jgi:hypothetical protein
VAVRGEHDAAESVGGGRLGALLLEQHLRQHGRPVPVVARHLVGQVQWVGDQVERFGGGADGARDEGKGRGAGEVLERRTGFLLRVRVSSKSAQLLKRNPTLGKCIARRV